VDFKTINIKKISKNRWYKQEANENLYRIDGKIAKYREKIKAEAFAAMQDLGFLRFAGFVTTLLPEFMRQTAISNICIY